MRQRVVIDTNVWLSAALSPMGTPSQIVRRVLVGGWPLFSEATFSELETRIWKPKFDRYLSMEARKGILHDARSVAHWVKTPAQIAAKQFSRDLDDDKFIHTALAGAAPWIVTGDQDLLILKGTLPTQIVSPAEALTIENFCKS